jgi:ABC-type transporter lipoprotein component MlaA
MRITIVLAKSVFIVSKALKLNKAHALSFFAKLQKTASDTFQTLRSAYGEERLFGRSAFELHGRFNEGAREENIRRK